MSAAGPAVGRISLAFLAVVASACRPDVRAELKLQGVQSLAPLNEALGETSEPDEERLTNDIMAAVLERLVKENPPGHTARMPRDAHRKMHGCVVGRFRVDDDLPSDIARGVFVPGRALPAYVRFSNSDANVQPDKTGDARGMAIKLVGVPGEKLIADEKQAVTHDFMLINGDHFFVQSLKEYVAALRAIENGPVARDAWFLTHPHAMKALESIFQQPMVNPVTHTYYSATPYALGEQAVKYRARPCEEPPQQTVPEKPPAGYLHDAMKNTLAERDVCYRFAVQRRARPESMPIEDATVIWSESDAPFVDIATLTIPRQDFDTEARRGICEDLSFTPWHALGTHKPLGAVNRARLRVYELISRYRNRQNGVAHVEPSAIGDAAL